MSYKSVLVNLAMLLGGGVAGFFVGKKIYEGYYAAIAQEEIDSVKEKFKRYEPLSKLAGADYDGDNIPEITKEDKKIPLKVINTNAALTRSSLDGNANERAKRNYNLVGSKPIEPDEEDEDDDDEVRDAAGKTEAEMMDLTKVDRTMPYVINDVEFSEEFDHHDKISLYYYKEDQVLCDEHEEIMEDPEGTIGSEALEALETNTTVWVRNEPICIDYEIISLNKSYAEAVGGIMPEENLTPRERYLRQQKARERNAE